MAWRISFDRRAEKEFFRLADADRERLRSFLDDRILVQAGPRVLGAPLTGRFAGLWKYRVGDLSIIAQIRDGEMLILVVQIGNRREIYR